MVDNDDKVESLHIMLRITSLHRIASKISFCIKYKRFILIELMFLKELILIRQGNQKSAIFVSIGIFKIKGSTKCLEWIPRFINDVYLPLVILLF